MIFEFDIPSSFRSGLLLVLLMLALDYIFRMSKSPFEIRSKFLRNMLVFMGSMVVENQQNMF